MGNSRSRGLSLLLALIAAAAAGVPFVLPQGEDPARWQIALDLAGFERASGATGTRAELVVDTAGCRLRVVDRSGQLHAVSVACPATARAREDLVWLARSLLEPGVPATPTAPRVADLAPPPKPAVQRSAPAGSNVSSKTTKTTSSPPAAGESRPHAGGDTRTADPRETTAEPTRDLPAVASQEATADAEGGTVVSPAATAGVAGDTPAVADQTTDRQETGATPAVATAEATAADMSEATAPTDSDSTSTPTLDLDAPPSPQLVASVSAHVGARIRAGHGPSPAADLGFALNRGAWQVGLEATGLFSTSLDAPVPATTDAFGGSVVIGLHTNARVTVAGGLGLGVYGTRFAQDGAVVTTAAIPAVVARADAGLRLVPTLHLDARLLAGLDLRAPRVLVGDALHPGWSRVWLTPQVGLTWSPEKNRDTR